MATTAGYAFAAALVLAGCASQGGAVRDQALQARRMNLSAAAVADPELLAFIQARVARLANRPAYVVLRRGSSVRAELAPDGTVHIWEGMLLRVRDDAELAFVLAHELAHGELGHLALSPRTQVLELEADRHAVAALARTGLDVNAGATLLSAVLEESLAAPSGDEDARALLRARLRALPAAQKASASAPGDAWIELAQSRRAAWLARDPAASDAARRAVLLAHLGVSEAAASERRAPD